MATPPSAPLPATLPAVALLNVDSPIGLAIMRELGQRGVPVVAIGRSATSLGRHSRYASGFVERPVGPIKDWLNECAKAEGFERLIAISEGDLIQLAAIKRNGKSAVQLAVPDPEKLQIVLDKSVVNQVAEQAGIDVPRSWMPISSNPADLADLSFPLAIKWPDPNAIIARLESAGIDFVKVEYAADSNALAAALSRYDRIGQYPLVQEYCRGLGLGQMFYMHRGQPTLRFQHQRLREWPLSGGVSSLCEALPPGTHAKLMGQSEVLLRELDWEGPAMVEYKFDPETGRAKLMEINGRFWGSQPLASACGVHFGWEHYRRSFLADNSPAAPKSWTLRRARYAAPELKNLRDVAISDRSLGKKLRFAAGFIADFLDPRVRYYVWSLRDPKPFLCELGNIISRFWRKES